MTKWNHKVDLTWLTMRQTCLTATDVKDLLPVTKTGRPRKVGDEAYLKVYARKNVLLSKSDTESTGAAARGHILEPYAIRLYNDNNTVKQWLYHWDDFVVVRPNHRFGQLAFSPDALDLDWRMFSGGPAWRQFDSLGPRVLGEVKSYSAENHIAKGCTPKEELEERWQIATAMAVCPTIEEAHLLFYNPSMKLQMFDVVYTPKELKDEIETVLDVEDNWLDWLDSFDFDNLNCEVVRGSYDREKEIVEEIIKREAMNPDTEKTVEL